MLRAITFMFKFMILTVFILAIGNSVHFNGKTVSDHLQTQMSHAENSNTYQNARSWAADNLFRIKNLISNKLFGTPIIKKRNRVSQTSLRPEEIFPTEQQKLRALIRDLNSESSLAK